MDATYDELVAKVARLEQLLVDQVGRITSVNDCAIIVDELGNVLDASDGSCRSLRYTKGELLEKNIRELLLPEGVVNPAPSVGEPMIHPAAPQRQLMRRKDGTIVSVEWTSKTLPGGQTQAVFRETTEGQPTTLLERYRLLFLHLEEGCSINEIITDEKGQVIDFRILDANPAYERQTGIAPRDVVGKTLLETKPFADRHQIQKYGNVALTGTPTFFDYFSETFHRHFHVRVFCPQIGYFAAVFEDVTARKTSEDALKESEARWRFAIEGAGDGIWDWNVPEGKVFFSRRWKEMLGFAEDEIGDGLEEWSSRVHPMDLGPVMEAVRAHLDGLTPFYTTEHRVRCKDGTWKWILDRGLVVHKSPEGKALRVVGTHADMTERRNAEADLRRLAEMLEISDRRFMDVLEASSDAVLLLQGDRFVYCNKATARMLEYESTQQILETPPLSLLPPTQPDGRPSREKAMEVLERTRTEGANQFPWVVRRADGTDILVEVSTTLMTLRGKPMIHIVWRDLTERKRLEAAVAQAERLSTMGLLAAGLAHEINNPLASVLFNTESLVQDLPKIAEAVRGCSAPNEQAHQLTTNAPSVPLPTWLNDAANRAEDAHEAGLRIMALTHTLAAFSRIQREERTQVDLNQSIREALSMVQNEIKYRAKLVADLTPLPPVWASEGKLAQIFLNLLVNATQAIEEGHVAENTIWVRTWTEGENVFASVADTGSGIAPEHLGRIFEPFFSTRPIGKGSGLGLSICRKLVTEFSGDIRVETDFGKGARFIVRLPSSALQAQPPPEPSLSSPSTPPKLRGRILVIDDEAGIRKALTRVFDEDHDVVTAPSGQAAKELLEHEQAFDVILCDLMMPEVTGMELHEWIADHYPALADRVVFVTGGVFTPRAEEYLSKVKNLRLNKPFDVEGLVKLVGNLVAAAQSPPQ